MKKVAGSLRLDLAQYRELEAFTKFGSELDKSTQAQLSRGERLIEMLKQPQYEPYSVDDQVIIINIMGQGLIDDIPVGRIVSFEKEFLGHIKQNYPSIKETLLNTKELSSETANNIKNACEEFKKVFLNN